MTAFISTHLRVRWNENNNNELENFHRPREVQGNDEVILIYFWLGGFGVSPSHLWWLCEKPVSPQWSTGCLNSAQHSAGLFTTHELRLCICCWWHSTGHLNRISPSSSPSLLKQKHFKGFGQDGCVERRHNLEGVNRLNIDRITAKALKYRENLSIYVGNKNRDYANMEIGYIVGTQCCNLGLET